MSLSSIKKGMQKWNIIHLRTVPSTHQYAKHENCQEYHVIWTTDQTQGLGRKKQDWESPPGHLAVTVILPLKPFILQKTAFSLHVGQVLLQTLQTHFYADFKIKWPNDIFLNNKKCAGLLCDADHGKGLLYVSFGLNLNNTIDSLSPNLQNTAQSLRTPGQSQHTPLPILKTFLNLISQHSQQICRNNYLYLNQPIIVRDQSDLYQGSFLDIGPQGELLIKENTGAIRPLYTGTLRKA